MCGHPSVKDTIEALGVPHPEVDLLLVNGEWLCQVSGRGARSDEDPGLLAQARRFETERLHPSRTSEIRVAP